MKQPRIEKRPLCPLAGFAECRAEQCMLWDDDWRVCSLNNGSLYSMVRAAACDAAVEIAGAGVLPQSPSAIAPSGRKPFGTVIEK